MFTALEFENTKNWIRSLKRNPPEDWKKRLMPFLKDWSVSDRQKCLIRDAAQEIMREPDGQSHPANCP